MPCPSLSRQHRAGFAILLRQQPFPVLGAFRLLALGQRRAVARAYPGVNSLGSTVLTWTGKAHQLVGDLHARG